MKQSNNKNKSNLSFSLIFGSLWVLLSAHASATSIKIKITDQDGEPVANVVVAAKPQNHKVKLDQPNAVIDQINKEYQPQVIAVMKGTWVSFPNKDNIRHHVYSFSKAKKFELPLYEGTPAEPILFDQPGAVTLGCNIHDWMRGYIYVAETPYLAISNEAGEIELADLPTDNYDLSSWHPALKNQIETLTLSTEKTTSQNASIVVELQPMRNIQRAPPTRRRRYN